MMTDNIAAHIAEVRAVHYKGTNLVVGYCLHCLVRWPCPQAETIDLLEAEHERAERLVALVREHKAAYTGQRPTGPNDIRRKREATVALYAALEAQEATQ